RSMAVTQMQWTADLAESRNQSYPVLVACLAAEIGTGAALSSSAALPTASVILHLSFDLPATSLETDCARVRHRQDCRQSHLARSNSGNARCCPHKHRDGSLA